MTELEIQSNITNLMDGFVPKTPLDNLLDTDKLLNNFLEKKYPYIKDPNLKDRSEIKDFIKKQKEDLKNQFILKKNKIKSMYTQIENDFNLIKESISSFTKKIALPPGITAAGPVGPNPLFILEEVKQFYNNLKSIMNNISKLFVDIFALFFELLIIPPQNIISLIEIFKQLSKIIV